MNNAAPCSICSEQDHLSSACPSLRDVLKEGFYSGGGSGSNGGHGDHEDEDDSLAFEFRLAEKKNNWSLFLGLFDYAAYAVK